MPQPAGVIWLSCSLRSSNLSATIKSGKLVVVTRLKRDHFVPPATLLPADIMIFFWKLGYSSPGAQTAFPPPGLWIKLWPIKHASNGTISTARNGAKRGKQARSRQESRARVE